MQISVENTGELGRKLKVQVPHEEVESRIQGRIRDLGKQVRLKGFRPGKIPYQVLEKRYGPQVRQEVVGELIQKSFEQAVSQENLHPASRPEIAAEPPKPNADLEYTASFEVFPELDELDLSQLKIQRPVAEVKDEDVSEMVETLRRQRRNWQDVERPAEEGDLVFFHYSLQADEERFPQEDRERAAVILGQNAYDAAFEAELPGLKAGDEKNFEVQLDADFREPTMAGKRVQAEIQVEKVQTSILPEVNDEFIASFGIADGGEAAFLKEIRANLNRELKQGLSRRLRNRVLDQLIAKFDSLTIPATMVEAEKVALRGQFEQQLKDRGAEGQEAPPLEKFAAEADRRVRAALLVREVARHGRIEVDGARVRESVNEIAATYENPQAIINLYYSDEQLLGSVQNVVLEEQAVAWILDQAQVEDQQMSFSEVMRPASSS